MYSTVEGKHAAESNTSRILARSHMIFAASPAGVSRQPHFLYIVSEPTVRSSSSHSATARLSIHVMTSESALPYLSAASILAPCVERDIAAICERSMFSVACRTAYIAASHQSAAFWETNPARSQISSYSLYPLPRIFPFSSHTMAFVPVVPTSSPITSIVVSPREGYFLLYK